MTKDIQIDTGNVIARAVGALTLERVSMWFLSAMSAPRFELTSVGSFTKIPGESAVVRQCLRDIADRIMMTLLNLKQSDWNVLIETDPKDVYRGDGLFSRALLPGFELFVAVSEVKHRVLMCCRGFMTPAEVVQYVASGGVDPMWWVSIARALLRVAREFETE